VTTSGIKLHRLLLTCTERVQYNCELNSDVQKRWSRSLNHCAKQIPITTIL